MQLYTENEKKIKITVLLSIFGVDS